MRFSEHNLSLFMGSKDISWAIDTLEEHLTTLEEQRKNMCDRADIPTVVFQSLHDLIDDLHERYDELLYYEENGLDIDVQQEFRLLCLEIQNLTKKNLWSLCQSWMTDGSLTVITHSITNVVRCIAGIEMAMVTMISSVCAGILVKDKAIRSIASDQKSVNLQLEMKTERLQRILQKSSDIRFAYIATEIFGMRRFQEIRSQEDE